MNMMGLEPITCSLEGCCPILLGDMFINLFVLKIAVYAGLPPAAQGHVSTLAAADRYCLIHSYYIIKDFRPSIILMINGILLLSILEK